MTQSKMTISEDGAVLFSILIGFMFAFLISVFPHMDTVAIILGVIFSWLALREEGIKRHYSLVASLIFIITAWFEMRTGWFPGEYYQVELIFMLIFGGIGLLIVLLQTVFGSITRGFGAVSFMTIVIRVKDLTPGALFAASLIPGILINLFFRIIPIPILSELVVILSSIANMAAILAISFSLKTIDRLLRWIHSL